MIDRVGNTRYTDAYINSARHTEATRTDAPAFLLGNEEEGVVWDRQSENKSEKKDVSVKNQNKNTKKDTYESSLKPAPSKEKKSNPEEIKKPAFMEPWSLNAFTGAVKNLFKSVKYVFKGLFDFIWYGEQKEDKEASDKVKEISGKESSEKSTSKNEAAKEGSEIKESDNTGKNKKPEKPYEITMEYVKKMNEGRTAARNTDLLTTYNKFGKTTYPSKSDAERILHTDKSNRV